jgi:hypothetical protein
MNAPFTSQLAPTCARVKIKVENARGCYRGPHSKQTTRQAEKRPETRSAVIHTTTATPFIEEARLTAPATPGDEINTPPQCPFVHV